MFKYPFTLEHTFEQLALKSQESLKPHLHSQIELIISLQGSFDVIVDGERVNVPAGCGVIVFPYQLHEYIAVDSVKAVVMLNSPIGLPQFRNYVNGFLPKSCLVGKELIGDEIYFLIERCTYFDMCRPKGWEMMLASYRYLILSNILIKLELRPATSDNIDSLGAVMNYINSHYTEPITVESASESLRISHSLISHMLAKKLHIGFHAYVNLLRVQCAIEQLTTSDMSISNIALNCGFGSFVSFNRVFKSLVGKTPSEYRTHVLGGTK